MRPQITFPKSLKKALNYNEKKVQKESAVLLHAQNFLKLPLELNIYDKLKRFEDLMALNESADTKVIHISLNFHPSEKERLTGDFFIQLADEYMEKMGFGNQPYLVYQHFDAGHPHVHVLSTLIKEDGRRIPTHNIGINLSEPTQKEMEQRHGFIPADKKKEQLQQAHHLIVTPQKVQAGKSATMRSITSVLDHVIDHYKYTSLQELNAILKLYNIKADRGAEDGRIYKHRGLTYVVIDKEGKSLTKPVKASAFHSKPTLDYIEGKFVDNDRKREPDKKHLKTAIDWAMRSEPHSLGTLAKLLQKEHIDLVIRTNEQGRVYGITYVDHEKKTVFNGSDLGKEYSAKRIQERLGMEQQQTLGKQQEATHYREQSASPSQSVTAPKVSSKEDNQAVQPEHEAISAREADKPISRIIEQVVEPNDGTSNAINKELLTEQKRKKKNFEKKWEM